MYSLPHPKLISLGAESHVSPYTTLPRHHARVISFFSHMCILRTPITYHIRRFWYSVCAGRWKVIYAGYTSQGCKVLRAVRGPKAIRRMRVRVIAVCAQCPLFVRSPSKAPAAAGRTITPLDQQGSFACTSHISRPAKRNISRDSSHIITFVYRGSIRAKAGTFWSFDY
jgi:hypothetical protein